MSKCAKAKNPCKICLLPVTQKNGLQCQGNCASWVHFNCINYTPGKIKDIKAGLLKINCPCPDCKTTTEKEYYTNANAGYTCQKASCPATKPPVCSNKECVVNIKNAACGTKASMDNTSQFSPTSSMENVGDTTRFSGGLESDINAVCETVGRLTQQITSLMTKLKTSADPNSSETCIQSGPKALCPKPCYCANNPGQNQRGRKK